MKKSLILVLSLLGACATSPAAASKSEEATLLLQLDAEQLNNKGQPKGVGVFLFSYKLKNLETGKIYTVTSRKQNTPDILHIAPGPYCLYSVSPYANVELTFCSEPFFKVEPGRMNNAGKWRFGISFESHTRTLIYSMRDLAEVTAKAKAAKPELFEAAAKQPEGGQEETKRDPEK
jgi:hypothetical protein